MLWLRSLTIQVLAIATLTLGATGCPRHQFVLGDDWRDAGPDGSGNLADASQNAGAACGSRGLPACAAGEFCDFPRSAMCGDADAPGVCKVRPSICTQVYAPVCGCDGKTYPSACNGASTGVSVAHVNACDAPADPVDAGSGGSTCGGLRGAQCAAGQYCNFAPDAQCGAADQTGICTGIPQACTLELNPVCGCDDKTYSNACAAASAGISVASKGACATTDGGAAPSCGGRSTATCPKGQFCNIPESGICGTADASGTCTTPPSACTKEYKPVCGCDDKTYGNACTAAAASVSVKAQGECMQTCGGLAGKTCAKGEYCDFPQSTMCGSGDQTGICMLLPSVCTQELNQVCGCDGKTYDNPCYAHVAGTSIRASGACPTAPAGETCGGLLGKTCTTKGQYCNFPESTMCGSGDQTGTCADMPQVCTLQYDPVCGCDGTTYGNRCAAAAAGVSVESAAACP
jgi:hypothetical protein